MLNYIVNHQDMLRKEVTSAILQTYNIHELAEQENRIDLDNYNQVIFNNRWGK